MSKSKSISKHRLQQEAVQFFRQEPGLKRLLNQLIQRYKTLGRIGGSVTIRTLTAEEREALSRLFRKDYTRQSTATITMEKFAQALHKTKFAELEIQDILEGVHGGPIVTRAQEEEAFVRRKEQFFNRLFASYSHPYCQRWLKYIEEKKAGTRGMHSAYQDDAHRFKQRLENVLKALPSLPGEGRTFPTNAQYERLPVFASRLTGDPHAFDVNTEQGRYFIHALQVLRQHEDPGYGYQSSPSAEQVTEIMQSFGIIRDDILNFVTCTGLLGFTDSAQTAAQDRTNTRKGKPHQEQVLSVWQSALNDRQVLNVPLRDLVQVDRFLPAHGYRTVFVVENSGVFSAILDHFVGQDGWPPLICTHGQFKLATLLLLDQLVKQNVTIYYSGDFDPEGLQMASRLLYRHPSFVRLWRMGVDDYLHCHSGLPMTSSQLSKLESVTTPVLKDVIREMKRTGITAFQEDLIPSLIQDIENI